MFYGGNKAANIEDALTRHNPNSLKLIAKFSQSELYAYPDTNYGHRGLEISWYSLIC